MFIYQGLWQILFYLKVGELVLYLANIETLAPLLANAVATAFPIPLDPPVIITCLPFRSWNVSLHLLKRVFKSIVLYVVNTGSYPLFLDIISYPDPRSQSGYISRSYIQIWHRIYIISRSISISLFSVNFCFKKYLSFQLYTSSNLVLIKSMAVDWKETYALHLIA